MPHRADGHWHRQALQMMKHPRQVQAKRTQSAYMPPVHVPPQPAIRDVNDVYVSPNIYPPRRRQQRPIETYNTRAAYQQPVQNQMPAPQNNGSPTMRPTRDFSTAGFVPKNDRLSKFRQTQLSSESLIHRRTPGLQDRISNLLSAPRYEKKPGDNRAATKNPGNRLYPPPVSRPPQKMPTQLPNDSIAETKTNDRTNRRLENEPRRTAERENSREQVDLSPVTTRPVNRAFRAKHAYAQEAASERTESKTRNSKRSPRNRDFSQVALREPVVSEPKQDPYGDKPSFQQASPLREAPQQIARQDGPISVLNRPADIRNKFSNQPYRPQSRSIEAHAEPNYDYAPDYQDQSERFDLSQEDLQVPTQFDSITPSNQELERPIENNLDDIQRLEELPEASDQSDPFQDELDKLNEDEGGSAPERRACEEFRTRLLNTPITDIALDISPPGSRRQHEFMTVSRTWTDRGGHVLGTGTMARLSRGYVVLNSGQKIAHTSLSDADLLAISEFWQVPNECSIGNEAFAGRHWMPQTFTWKASSLCHKPLYFENIQLERYGHSHGPFLQPVMSAKHFFISLISIPYQTGIHPANECEYALGFYRPGDCAPWLREPFPISLDGMKRQALVTVGLAYIP